MKMSARELPRSYWRKVAEKSGILRHTFNARISAGWPINEAATKPLRSEQQRQRRGAKHLCRQAGLHPDSVYQYRRARNGAAALTDEQIVERIQAWHARPNISELSRQSGISRATISRRLKAGWTVEKATSTPPIPPEARPALARKSKSHAWAQKWEGVA